MRRELKSLIQCVVLASSVLIGSSVLCAKQGECFPSERKLVTDPVTGAELVFLTSTQAGDSKIYPTHPQWTADGKWLVFRSKRVAGQAMAVNEESGVIVQLTATGYQGSICLAQQSMRMFFNRPADHATRSQEAPKAGKRGKPEEPKVPVEVVELNLEALFADSAAGEMKGQEAYERVVGVIPVEIGGAGELALDADEKTVYFRMVREAAEKLIAPETKIETNFGPRNMGAGPTGIAKMDVATGKIETVAVVPFQVGHIQSNPWTPGDIIFCWETGGKSPQRSWMVKSDGTGLKPLYPEAPYDWVTHEAVIGPDEVAFAILGHRKEGVVDGWGPCGTRAHPTGLGIMNLRSGEMLIAGQTKSGSGFWHVHGSADGRWAVGDDFDRNLWLIDRRTNEMMLLTTGHRETAADHVHPTFNREGTKIGIQSAMLSEDKRTMNICVVPVPKAWLEKHYDENTQPKNYQARVLTP